MRESHWYCTPCERSFNSESNLESHSSIHKPKDFRCPGANCARSFVSQSALIQHWESGTCPSRITRDIVNQEVVNIDRNNVITNPSRLIRGPDGCSPSTSSIFATNRSWNGSSFECFLCHKEFRTLQSLNAHLQSPRHQDKIYRCPNQSGCGLEFSALSSLCQHVERDRCGVQMFRGVRQAMESLVSGVKRVAM
jgi:hypothetical protein